MSALNCSAGRMWMRVEEYSISKEELDYLAKKVERLKEVTERPCEEKIEGISSKKA